MNRIFFIIFYLFLLNKVCAQDSSKYSVQFNLGYSKVNYKDVRSALKTSFSFNMYLKSRLNYQFNFDYILGSKIKTDDRSVFPQVLNYNTHLQQSQFSALLGYNILNNTFFVLDIKTGLSLIFLKESFVNNIYEKKLYPNLPPILVSESTFARKFQIGSTSCLEATFNFKRLSPGLSIQYQIQKEYQFISPSIFVSYKL